MKRKNVFKGQIFIGIGIVLVLAAVILFACNQWADAQAGRSSQEAKEGILDAMEDPEVKPEPAPAQSQDPDAPEQERAPDSETVRKIPSLKFNGAYYLGILSVPKLGKELPVQTDWSYPKLKVSPCRYSGSLENGGLVIAAHNYFRHLGGMSRLSQGDPVSIMDVYGGQYQYQVQEILQLEADQVDAMVNSGYDLTLFACNYGGRARVTVRCDLIGYQPPA